MSFDNYRTQVLLLHSEQNTLDTLSARFNERFTVHCATSGTEALNTLGETPIHVIVSAQDLPGMSGAEALREAKKRSPETIGILLAGQDDKDVEALVGDKEVFQIVQGGISSDELSAVIDNATQRMRLLALAESANDTRALPDETGEHIVMETADNGSAIVTDAKGSPPAAANSSVSPATGAGTVEVLVLSKDEEFIATVRESTNGNHQVHGATKLAEAEKLIGKQQVGVVVVDAGLVGSRVEKLTAHLRQVSPRVVSVVAGRRDDGEMLMGLINRGKVYRFLLKPLSPGRARLAIEASIKHHLEAPDSAFKPADPGTDTATTPEQKSKKPAASAKSSQPPKAAAATPAPKATTGQKAPVARQEAVNDPIVPTDVEVDVNFDKLGEAFDAGDSSLKQTVTGLVSTVSKAVASKPGKISQQPHARATQAAGSQSALGAAIAERKWVGLAAVAVLLLLAGASFLTTGSDDASSPAPEASAADSEAATDAALPEESNVVARVSDTPVEELLSRARLLQEVGRVYAPVGNNAIEMYMKAAAADPRNDEIADEFAEVVTEALTLGESAMLEGRVSDAALAISQVQAADPENPRLPFLSAQIRQMQLRDYLAAARAAILDSRFQDAADAIGSARSLNPPDRSEIDSVQAELDSARSAERVDDVLAKAAARLDAGRLVAPANDNARHYYELALANDPGNATAEAGLRMLVSSLVLEARSDIDAGRFDAAGRMLTNARSIDSRSAEVIAASKALDDARERRAEAERVERERRAAAEREAEAERIAAEKARQEEAEQAAAAAALAATDKAGAADGTAQAATDTAEQNGAGTAEAASNPTVAAPVPVSTLTRTKYVAPKYPRAAERRGISGWVDVVFTVGIDGSVSDVEVRASEPGDVFINSALKAVEKWEFEPIIENERYVEKRAGVRMMFAMQ